MSVEQASFAGVSHAGRVFSAGVKVTRMFPIYFKVGTGADAPSAGVERIDGEDYFFGDIDVALTAFRSYLEGLPVRDAARNAPHE